MIENEGHNASTILIIDRKPKIRPKNDLSVVNYLQNKEKQIYFYYSGNSGINIADNLKGQKFTQKNINISTQRKLKKLLKITSEIPQIIE